MRHPIFLPVRCLLILLTLLPLAGCSDASKPPVTPPPAPVAGGFVKGADISWLTEMEAAGIRFYTRNGAATDCIALLKSLGMNTIRLRVWVNPATNWNKAADVVAKAVRAKNLGMRILINFHYSDTWADPGSQNKPALWGSLGFTELQDALAGHTREVLTQLKQAGVNPEWVQVGNETNDGMLWPDGKASSRMAQFARLFQSGYAAVKAIFPEAKVMVHLSNGYDNNLYRWLLDGLTNNGASFDVIGLSLYPSYFGAGWQAANQQCLANMNDLVSRYGKPVMVVETGMPWDQADTCKAFLSDLISKVKSVSGAKGLGVLYWEPECHNNWKGYTLGAFDNGGRPTVALDAFAD